MKCPWIVLTMALTRWNHMNLYAGCCAASWDASAAEFAAIRRLLDAGRDDR